MIYSQEDMRTALASSRTQWPAGGVGLDMLVRFDDCPRNGECRAAAGIRPEDFCEVVDYGYEDGLIVRVILASSALQGA